MYDLIVVDKYQDPALFGVQKIIREGLSELAVPGHRCWYH